MSDGHWRPFSVNWRMGGLKTGRTFIYKVLARDVDEAWEIVRKHGRELYPRRQLTLINVQPSAFYD